MRPKTVRPKDRDIEVRPDAWERFVMAIGYAVKTPAIHRETKKAQPTSKGRARKSSGR